MQFTNFITAAILAISATALPNASPNAALEVRHSGWKECKEQGGKWDWFKKTCETNQPSTPSCPYGQEWDSDNNCCSSPPDYPPSCPEGEEWSQHEQCCVTSEYPVMEQPTCGEDEQAYCSCSKKEYTSYNAGNEWCKKDKHGKNKVWCSKDKDAEKECKKHY